MTRALVLIADDYALTPGVCDAIRLLAESRRISGTSVLVTEPCFEAEAAPLTQLRPGLALGLHVNLTLGAPLGAMPALAPLGRLPALMTLTQRALMGTLDLKDIESEITRQLVRFEEGIGAPPDFIDGHQHVHVMPGIRHALFRAVRRRGYRHTLLVRHPADSVANIWCRGEERRKALGLAVLSTGFAAAARTERLLTNTGFSGVSAFDPDATERDFAGAARCLGSRHLMMCHPGFPDAALARLDPVTDRRKVEYEALSKDNATTPLLWHPKRSVGGAIDWLDSNGESWR
ncbi:MAG: ChbG/HpnK family deacetylase [Hyphomicrobium sp.]